MSFILISIVGITVISILLWLLASNYRTQRALRWWHSRQLARMRQEGEAIRNEVLQNTFVLRRHLESPLPTSSESQHKLNTHYLENIEKFHYSLKELSDYLYPAYVDESLPLAIRHMLDTWNKRFPSLNIQYELPNEWREESRDRSQVILIALEELLNYCVSNTSTNFSLFVSLTLQGNLNELMIKFTDLDVSKSTLTAATTDDLLHLCRALKFWLSGKCSRYRQNQTEIWYLRW
ncbi:hypothetical protein NIES37_67540 [Tolypothrix tenuis PCC 7101]|uniref:Uncharacterized protein n=1 Tax=Tolypothrix tenuis PCC 7101 TaxID=231146 RepID=A0A1Z4NAK5_9CYAN|nr:hypothetical protein NIES37_67540 [Tolypothrix tenuis PCC 7101]BAZ78366.1 hypothetical protein NIES50_69990 [Aulosira laxa NIES-50]